MCCKKTIKLGQAITECSKCDTVIHTRCYKKSSFQPINNNFYCKTCAIDIHTRYNPFQYDSQCDDSHFYNEELGNVFESMQAASSVLQNCTQYNICNLNKASESLVESNNYFSSLFLNIDGNNIVILIV